MKKLFCLLLSVLLLTGCASTPPAETTAPPVETTQGTTVPPETTVPATDPVLSGDETVILLSDEGITVESGSGADGVFVSHDIIYYEDRDAYESGNPYGEGEAKDRHSAAEASAHTVVNITKPGNYVLSGKLSAGQIRVDLGDDAYEDPTAVVNLILNGVDITCTVAPAILFLNVYECDGNWSEETAKAQVDTTAAGANLILRAESSNTVNGSYVAKIYKDKDGEKKLWKQDGAIYSYMSMNVAGTGSLDLTAENEGLDTELHLTINGGDIVIRSGNDGINTNEDNVSVTTINGGRIHILAGLDQEGDGIDSNGYLVINGGTVISSAHPAADAGLDSDLGSYINGGSVIAFGSTMDWAESESSQVTMNLQFAQYCTAGSTIRITDAQGNPVFSFDPNTDEVLMNNARQFQGVILSCPAFQVGDTYQVYLNGVQQAYTGTDVSMMPPGGFGGNFGDFGDFGGQRPEGMGGFGGGQGGFPGNFGDGNMPEDFTMPEDMNDFTMPEGMTDFTMPEGGGFSQEGFGQWGQGEMPTMPEGETMPQGMDQFGGQFDGQFSGQRPGSSGSSSSGEASTQFYMQDKVNSFSGLAAYISAQ